MNSEAISKILEYSIQTITDALTLEKKNAQQIDEIHKSENYLAETEIDVKNCLSALMKLNEKRQLLKNKKSELIEMQKQVISLLSKDQYDSFKNDPSEFIYVPPIIRILLNMVYDTIEKQIDANNTKIHLSDLFELIDSINGLHDKLVQQGIISETEAESQARNESIADVQQLFLNQLTQALSTSDSNCDENDNEEEENHENTQDTLPDTEAGVESQKE